MAEHDTLPGFPQWQSSEAGTNPNDEAPTTPPRGTRESDLASLLTSPSVLERQSPLTRAMERFQWLDSRDGQRRTQILSEAATIPYCWQDAGEPHGPKTHKEQIEEELAKFLEDDSSDSSDQDSPAPKVRRVEDFKCQLCKGGSGDIRLEDSEGPVKPTSNKHFVTCRTCSKFAVALIALKEARRRKKPISRRQFQILDSSSDIIVNTLLEHPETLATNTFQWFKDKGTNANCLLGGPSEGSANQ